MTISYSVQYVQKWLTVNPSLLIKIPFNSFQLASKDAKIEQLQRKLSIQSEIDKLQNHCKKIYEETGKETREKMEEVVKRAKHPGQNGRRKSSLQSLDESDVVITPVMRSLPDPVSTRSKVFRHKLQRLVSDTHEAQDTSSNSTASFVSLPNNYKANVATLPPIVARTNAGDARLTEVEVAVLADVTKSAKDRRMENSVIGANAGPKEESFA